MVVNSVKESFRARVSERDWLSEMSKQRSLDKVDTLVDLIAYPELIFDDNYVNGLYSSVSDIKLVH